LQEVISPVEELRLDTQELATLIKISTRPAVQSELRRQLRRTERQIERQEDLIAEGDRLAEAAMKLIKKQQYLQAKLELSAAKSSYQRGAADDKAEMMAQIDDAINSKTGISEKSAQMIATREDKWALAAPLGVGATSGANGVRHAQGVGGVALQVGKNVTLSLTPPFKVGGGRAWGSEKVPGPGKGESGVGGRGGIESKAKAGMHAGGGQQRALSPHRMDTNLTRLQR
jgi:hypothetical protein